jgi:hypothetical protein
MITHKTAIRIILISVCCIILHYGCDYAYVDHPLYGKIYQKDETVLPKDFPQEIFIEYWTRVHYAICAELPLPGNVICWMYDEQLNYIAAMYLLRTGKDTYRAWGFLKIESEAELLWISKDAGEIQKKYIRREIEGFNQNKQEKFIEEVRYDGFYYYCRGVRGGGDSLSSVVSAEGYLQRPESHGRLH